MVQEISLRLQERYAKTGGPKTVDSESVLQVIEGNQSNSTRRVSGNLGFSQFSVVRHLLNLDKSIHVNPIMSHMTKTFKNILLTLVYICIYI